MAAFTRNDFDHHLALRQGPVGLHGLARQIAHRPDLPHGCAARGHFAHTINHVGVTQAMALPGGKSILLDQGKPLEASAAFAKAVALGGPRLVAYQVLQRRIAQAVLQDR